MPATDVLVPNYLVKINGQRLTQAMAADVMEVRVEEKLDLPARFSLMLSDPDHQWVNAHDLAEGGSVKVELGYLNDTVELFDGEITGLFFDYPAHGPKTMTVRGYDRLHRLAREKKTRTFRDMQESQIVQQIAGDASLQNDVESTTEAQPYLLQNNQTDLEFLHERGERLGFELGISGEKLIFRRPKENLEPVATLELGKSLMELSGDISTIGQVSAVEVRGWDAQRQEVVVGTAGTESQNTTMRGSQSGADSARQVFGSNKVVILDNASHSTTEAENLAKARFRDFAMRYVTVDGRCQGNPKLRVGSTISIKGVGDKVNGTYYVVEAAHELGESGYVTGFKLLRNAR